MIHSLNIDGQKIPIAPQSVIDDPSSNIFSANSMMLFIGPNGAGKTTLLHRIAETVLRSDSLDVAYAGDLSKLRIVYLTLSPFGEPELGTGDSRRRVMFRKRVDDPIIPDAALFNTLSQAFTLPGKVELKLNKPRVEGWSHLINAAIRASRGGRLKGPAKLAAQIADVAKLDDEVREIRRNESIPFDKWFQTPAYASLKDAEAERDSAIVGFLRDRLAKDFEITMWAMTLVLPKTESQRASALKFFLAYFGFEVEHASRTERLQKKFETQLHELRELGKKLVSVTQDPLLRKSRYVFGLERLANIEDINLGAYAKIQLAGASSGMAALFAQFSLIQKGIDELQGPQLGKKNDLLLLLDEGDVFLHIAWQQRYVKALDAYMRLLREHFGCVQVVMTTHSPVMMSDFPRDHILRISPSPLAQDDNVTRSYDWEGRLSEVDVAFGAPLETIVRETGGGGTMGSFAEAIIEKMIDDAHGGKPIPQSRIDMVDDPVLRRLLNNARIG